MQCGGSTTSSSSSIYHTEGHAERNEDVSTFFLLLLLHFMEGGSIRSALRRTRPEQKPTTPVFFPILVVAPDDLYFSILSKKEFSSTVLPRPRSTYKLTTSQLLYRPNSI
jgi:hypothetical protein